MKIVIAVSGSSGSRYAKILIEKLQKMQELELALVYSQQALVNWKLENPEVDLNSYPINYYGPNDFNAPFASGSARWDGMIVCPCSAGFLAKVATGIAEDLMSRAAQVMLKERKKLILVFRETPLSLIHIENMKKVTLAGAIVCPAVPSFYSKPKDLDEVLSTVTDRAIDLVGLDSKSYQWGI
ncbi:MAG: UbiX family flavin prenyltransferase [Saprospiraceae bacterium]|nr:UbiX family flavin prenyltransferase [Candidatus Vicinibacter affinis]MBP6173930.1 UbiX family flavin prenyltransferase [Saprospiraceae bacterium]MBK6573043.1 UbiX family flavin prenyltransferase [Candidatus Vicinibacter affinis]MBK6822495.1 UbiX family flavin prenyltransferase [Candidatus Vicinibacter affinis]MBK7301724.1 UbiX family flavin prenyltransferase [Candidatus Vicinibacter affinis]